MKTEGTDNDIEELEAFQKLCGVPRHELMIPT